VEDPLVHPADHPWGYRNKLTLAFRDGPQPTAGFHAWDNPDVVFSLERCEIASPPLNRLWSALNPRLAAIPRGTARLVLREDEDGGCHITARDLPGDQWPSAEAVADALAEAGTAAALWIEPAGRAARRVAPRGADVPDSAQVFEQVNPVMGNRIRRRAVELLDAGPGVVVWDLYSGTGRATSLLASAGARVESIEQDQRAVALAGARGEGVHRHTGLVEQRLPTLGPVDRVLVNPPRTGLGPTVAGMLVDRRPGRIVYVSCDPATLARDVGVMTPAYRVTTVEAYDLFPQTAHVETVVALERREG